MNQGLARDSSKSGLRFVTKSLPPALAATSLGHANIGVTQTFLDNLRPCAFAQPTAGMHGAEAPKMLFNAGVGRVRISAKSGCKRSRVKRIVDVYVRNLPSRRLFARRRVSKDRRECHPPGARFAPFPYPRFVQAH